MTFLTLVPPIYYNIKKYGALGDGSTDDTTAIAAAISAAATNGGTVFFPPGTYISTTQTVTPNVFLLGAGPGVTIIKLKNATNADLFSANTSFINLSAAYGTGNAGGATNWGIGNMMLDGNKANQSSGTSYCLRVYGYDFALQNVVVQNGFTSGALIDWNGGDITTGDGVSAVFENVRFHHNNGIGLEMGGPHDSRFTDCSSYRNGTHCLHLAPNAQNMHFSNSRFYNPGTGVSAVCCLLEANKCYFTNCEASNSDNLNVAILANDVSWTGGNIYSNPGATIVGVQLGQTAGGTPISGSINQSAGAKTAVVTDGCFLLTSIYDCNTGAINEVNVADNIYSCRVHQTAGNAYASGGGYASNGAAGWLVVTGLTPDGSMGAGGYMIPGQLFSSFAFALQDSTNNPMFVVDTFVNRVYVGSGHPLAGYSDVGSTQTFKFDSSTGSGTLAGSLSTGQSATAAAIATNGTITTANIGEARVAPTGAVTGVILQAGTAPGQEVWVVNEAVAANTVTFAVAGTSHVADGVSSVIAGLRGTKFKWDSSTSLWYRG